MMINYKSFYEYEVYRYSLLHLSRGCVPSSRASPAETGEASPADTGEASPDETGEASSAETGEASPAETGESPAETGEDEEHE